MPSGGAILACPSESSRPSPSAGHTAFGAGANASGTGAVAIGAGASASAPNSVALGSGSTASLANTVSVCAPGAERRITNVAPGISQSDAVNVGQLQSVASGLQSQIGGLQSQINNVGRRLRDGVAVAMAAGGVPAVPTGRRIGVFGNIAAYDGHGAAGIGITASYMKPLATNSRPTARSVSASTRVLWVRVAGPPKDVKRLVVEKRHDRHGLSVRTTSRLSWRAVPAHVSSLSL